MASIHKTESGSHRVRWREPTGRMRSRTFPLRRDADAFATKVDHELRSRAYIDPDRGRLPVTEWAAEMMAMRIDLRPSTLARDWSYLRSLVLPTFGAQRLDKVSQRDVQRWVAGLAEEKAPATVRKASELLGKVFSTAVTAEMIPRSPCRDIKLPKASRTEMRALSPAELRDLVEATPPRYQALILTAAYTGLRFGELAGLHRDRLDLDLGSLTVMEALIEVQGRIVIGPPKTTASRRVIALPDFLARVLERHLLEYPSESDRVFTSSHAAPLRRSNFRRRVWLPAVRKTVGEPLRFHDLRHFHAALLIAEGVHPKVIQHRLGHTSITVTLDVYGHLFEGIDQAAADTLDRIGSATVPYLFPQADSRVPALSTRER